MRDGKLVLLNPRSADEHEIRWMRDHRDRIVLLLSEPERPDPVKEETAAEATPGAAKEKQQQEARAVPEPEPEVWYRDYRITERDVEAMLGAADDALRDQYRSGALPRAAAYAMARRWLRQRAQLGCEQPTKAGVPRWS